MKKLLSIALALLVLFTGTTINFASHYCGGEFIASKVSLSGKLASCGMEQVMHDKSGFNESDHTCEDFTSAITFSSNYIPSAAGFISAHVWFQTTELINNHFLFNEPLPLAHISVNRPPGDNPDAVDLEMICTFRI